MARYRVVIEVTKADYVIDLADYVEDVAGLIRDNPDEDCYRDMDMSYEIEKLP